MNVGIRGIDVSNCISVNWVQNYGLRCKLFFQGMQYFLFFYREASLILFFEVLEPLHLWVGPLLSMTLRRMWIESVHDDVGTINEITTYQFFYNFATKIDT